MCYDSANDPNDPANDQGTVDPTPLLYHTTLYSLAGLVSVAAVLHLLVRPVDSKYFETEGDSQQQQQQEEGVKINETKKTK